MQILQLIRQRSPFVRFSIPYLKENLLRETLLVIRNYLKCMKFLITPCDLPARGLLYISQISQFLGKSNLWKLPVVNVFLDLGWIVPRNQVCIICIKYLSDT